MTPDEIAVASAFRAAVIAQAYGAEDARQRADAVNDLLAAVPEPTAMAAFAVVVAQLELLAAGNVFEPAMLAGELLAACVLASPARGAVLGRWAERTHSGPRLAAMRACSKLCEYDTGLVDGDMLIRLAERNDIDEPTLNYLAQVAGRLRGGSKGVRLIESLANGDASRRLLAAHAITYSVAMDAPFEKLSAFARFGPPNLASRPPSRRLISLLAALLYDADAEVSAAAEQAAHVGSHAWPEMASVLGQLIWTVTGLPKAEESSSALPSRAVDFALRAPGRVSDRYGKLSWNRELLAEERAARAAGATLPRAIGAPRLFLSYRWADDPGQDTLIDHIAGLLHMTGYDIVFDRDPRYLDDARTAADVLKLMHDCSHFIPLATLELRKYLASKRSELKSALDLEWELARKLVRHIDGLRWVTLWLHGDRLPRALATRPHVDLRDSHDPLHELFPICAFEVHAFSAENRLQYRSPHVDRRGLRAAYDEATKRHGSTRCEIHDVTMRAELAALTATAAHPSG